MIASKRATRLAVAAPLVIALAAGMTGCASADAGSTEDVTSLTLIAANSPWTEGLKTLATEYKEETGVTVNLEFYGNEQLNDTLKVKLNAQSSDFDIYAYQVQDVMREFSRNGWLTDMTDYVTKDAEWDWDDFQASSRDAVTLDDVVYGVPVMTERHVMYYRSDLLDAAGIPVPTTLDELEAAAAKLHDPANGFYGVAMRGSKVPLVTQFSSFLYSFGGDFQDAKGNASVDTPEAKKAYEYYGNLLGNYGPPGVTNMGWVEASAIFAQGNAAFYLDADSQAYTFLDASNSAVVDTVAYGSFPAGPAGSKPYNIVPQTVGINAFSEKKDAAWSFISWVTNQKNSTWMLGEATVPVARDSAWADEKATAGFPAGLVDIVRNIGDSSVGHDRPQLEKVAQAREIVGTPAITAIEGGDVASASKSANKAFQELLDGEK